MKLLIEATIAGKSQVLADGLVRVHVTAQDTGVTIGRLSMTEELWQWTRDWIRAAADMGVIGAGMGVEIEIKEREHSVESGKRAETMRGRLLEAVQEAAARVGDVGDAGDGKGAGNASAGQDEAQGVRKHAIGGLYRQVQTHKKGK